MPSGILRPFPFPLTHLSAWAACWFDGEPEIRAHLHKKLVSWMEYRAYSKPDVDYADPKKAANGLAEFESEFGPPINAREDAWIERNADFLEDEGQF